MNQDNSTTEETLATDEEIERTGPIETEQKKRTLLAHDYIMEFAQFSALYSDDDPFPVDEILQKIDECVQKLGLSRYEIDRQIMTFYTLRQYYETVKIRSVKGQDEPMCSSHNVVE